MQIGMLQNKTQLETLLEQHQLPMEDYIIKVKAEKVSLTTPISKYLLGYILMNSLHRSHQINQLKGSLAFSFWWEPNLSLSATQMQKRPSINTTESSQSRLLNQITRNSNFAASSTHSSTEQPLKSSPSHVSKTLQPMRMNPKPNVKLGTRSNHKPYKLK